MKSTPARSRSGRSNSSTPCPTFSRGRARNDKKREEKLKDRLYRQIGQLQVEVDWLKKKSVTPIEVRGGRCWSRAHPAISIRRQCALLGLNRATAYYVPAPGESDERAILREKIDRQYTETPFYGVPRMTVHLRDVGLPVGEKRVRRLMRLMGLEAIYPKKRLSARNPAHKVYPYLLQRREGGAAGPGVVHGHHVHRGARRVRVPHRGDGLGEPVRVCPGS